VPVDVCLVGLDVDGVEHCDWAWSNTTLARAVRVAREALDRTIATGAVSLVAARAATDEDTERFSRSLAQALRGPRRGTP
jgi:hypothetical protein